MTNAEFRIISGNKIFFKNDDGYKSFHAADLNTNVLTALHVTAAALDAKQSAMDQANRNYEIQLTAAQKQAAIAQAKADQLARNKAAFLQQNSQPQSRYTGLKADGSGTPVFLNPPTGNTIKIKIDDGFPDRSQGNFIGN